MLKKILLIVGGLAVAGGIAAALIIFQPWGLIGWDKTPGMGNTNGNLNNIWTAVQDQGGEYVYYLESVLSRSITKMSIDGRQRQAFPYDGESLTISSLNLAGDWLYYSNNKGIWRTSIDGTKTNKISSDDAFKIHIVSGWIYYRNEENKYIYRIRTNGTGRQRLTTLGTNWLNVSNDGWIYYINGQDTDDAAANWHIYRMRTDGSDHLQISQERCTSLQLEGDWLYYKKRNDDGLYDRHLYRMRTDGTETAEVLNESVYNFIVKDDWIYYNIREEVLEEGDFKLHKIRLDGTEHQIISEEPMDYFSVVGDWVYGQTDPDRLFLITTACRVRTNGTGWENLVK